jgi:divalent metal cation (Fe/Co/Zn/Cd) transporter
VTVGLVVVAAATMAESLVRVASRSSGDHSLIGTAVAASSVVVLTSLARRKVRLGRAIPSKALVADGMLSTTGAVLALVTLLGTLLGVLGWWWADPVAALMVAIGALAVAVILARQ